MSITPVMPIVEVPKNLKCEGISLFGLDKLSEAICLEVLVDTLTGSLEF